MKKITLVFAIFLPFFLSAQLKINEIMTNNVSALMDESYNYSMWVELYNVSTSTSYNQSSYFFTDDLSQPRKWNPASKMITAGSYSLLWFEREDKAGHANFKLDPDGGKLYLLNASAQVVDSVKYPAQYRNTSYGRKTNGASEWVFFEQHSAGASNNGKLSASVRCAAPVLKIPGGFYAGTKNISFENPAIGDTIYYTLNGAEPTRSNGKYTPGYVITLTSTSILRAKTFSHGKLSSDIISATYFLNERDYDLPVVSIITEQKNLTDNVIGIYVQGTNGITGNGMNTPANWNQDWYRPANFELFDTTKTVRINQELDIQIAGGWTRMNKQKSLKINPRNKFYNKYLNYDIFKATKPNLKYKSILFRNSGNDFDHSMMRDGFMQSLVMKRMNIDYIAYEPAICFMNGVYYGIQNLRERSDVDYIFSNYGYEENEITLVESAEMASDTSFTRVTNYITNNDITQPAIYNKVCEMIDIDNFMNYFLTQIYLRNTDWPHNNIKAWKKKNGGKWRWILYDTDFGYNLWSNDHTNNTLTWALGEQSGSNPANNLWSTILLRRLVLNDTFRKRFIDRFAIHISSTFEANRANAILDSLAAKITTEILYHKTKWGSARGFEDDVNIMKGFSANRPNSMMNFISNRFLSGATAKTIELSSNQPKATFMFNSETIKDAGLKLKYFSNQNFQIKANPVPGYKFKNWLFSSGSSSQTLIANGSVWKYYDGNGLPATNWSTSSYSDATWKSGASQLGYGGKGEVTTVAYGSDANNKYPTAYFRNSVTISNLSSKTNFVISTFVDDGAVVYVNGTEVGRVNMPSGAISFTTYSTTYNNGVTGTFDVPKELLKEGVNVIAVEVHQTNANSSDLIFNLEMSCSAAISSQILTNETYSGTLTSDFSLQAIYEQTVFEDPDKDLKVRINEVITSNNMLQDEHGDTDDYIEIYNDGDNDINIAGWYVSDTPYNPTLFQLPTTDSAKTQIPAKGYLVLWADDEADQGVNHIDFKLSKDGEKLVLSKINYLGALMLVDSVSVPYLEQNISYSRTPDGGTLWIQKSPTMGFSNSFGAGYDDLAQWTVRVYPTLVDQHIIVENASGLNIQLFDIAGKKQLSQQAQSNREHLQLGGLRKGIYIMMVGNEKYKIVKM